MVKRQLLRKILVIFIFWLFLTSCERPGLPDGTRVWIDSPKAGTTVPVGTPLTIVAHANAPDGLAEVLIYVDGSPLDSTVPIVSGETFSHFQQVWTPTEAGTHTLQVWAYDINGQAGSPATVSITVGGAAPAEPEVAADTPTDTPEISLTPTETPVISETPTITPSPTETLTPTPTFTQSLTPTFTPSVTPVPPDTTPPPVPVPQVPANDLVVGCRSTQTLAWLPVDDPSGINGYYVALEMEVKKGEWQAVNNWGPLNDKQLEIPVNCGLRYRWIVRAEDGVGNFSDWSPPSHFAIGLD